jgi:ATP-dependent DNA ligase
VKKTPTTLAGLPHFLEPMKARLVDSRLPEDWIYEIKFDGYRALALRGGAVKRASYRGPLAVVVHAFKCSPTSGPE